MDKLLSICIPTYNRAKQLSSVLNNILNICINNKIDIYVSDNASNDETIDVCNNYSNICPYFHYYRHKKNIGPDDNFEYVLKMSNAKYRWLLSDTCYFDDISSLLDDLSSNDYNAYIVNGVEDRAVYLPKENQVYHSSILLMESLGWHLTWISCMIYHKDTVSTMNFERFKKSSFNQTGLIFETTANKICNIKFNPHIRILNLSDKKESAWTYHVFEIFYRDWYMFVMSLPVYYPYESKLKCITDCYKKSVVLTYKMHAKRRSVGKWSYKDIKKNFFFIKQSKQSIYIFLLLALIPSKVLDYVFMIAHYIKRYS